MTDLLYWNMDSRFCGNDGMWERRAGFKTEREYNVDMHRKRRMQCVSTITYEYNVVFQIV